MIVSWTSAKPGAVTVTGTVPVPSRAWTKNAVESGPDPSVT